MDYNLLDLCLFAASLQHKQVRETITGKKRQIVRGKKTEMRSRAEFTTIIFIINFFFFKSTVFHYTTC